MRERRSLYYALSGFVCFFMLFSGVLAGQMGVRSEGGFIFIENASVRYVLSNNGMSLSFFDKVNDQEYLDQGRTHNFMTLIRKEKAIPATSVLYERGKVVVRFNPDWTIVTMKVDVRENYFVFEIVDANNPDFDELQFCDLPLTIRENVGTTLNMCRNETFGVSLQALNYFTNCRVEESSPVRFVGSAYPEFNHIGTKLAVVTGPSGKMQAILGKMELEQGLAHATLDGVWGKISPDARKSYLFVDYTEANVDKAIEYSHKGGFGYLCMYLDTWATSCGKYKINLENYPRGFEGVEATVKKIHDAGLKAGAHTMSGSIYKSDEYVTPIPDPRLAKDGERILAADIGPDDDFIPATESPDGLPLESNYASRGGMDLQIGNELITYSGYSTTKPYGFTGCKRAAHGTYAASHKMGDIVYHMAERYNWYMVDGKTSLVDEIAGNVAGAINRCGFDWIYFDGSEALAGQGPYWYYVGKVLTAICERFDREVLAQGSSMPHFNWHHYSRRGTVDWVWIDQKRFVDSYVGRDVNTWKYRNPMPMEFGWFGYFLDSDRGESTTPDEVEYVLAKCLGHDAAWSFETRMKTLEAHGRTNEILEMSKNYENARLSGYFSEAVRAQLQKNNSDFKLETDGKGGWTISPIQYGPEKYVRRNDGQDNKWNYINPYSAQSFRVRLKARPEPAAYDDNENIVIVDTRDVSRLTPSPANPVMALSASVSQEQVKVGDASIKLSAANTSDSVSSWVAQTLHFEKPLNLSKHHPVGLWIYGNGTGGALVIQLLNPSTVYSHSHIVDLNFTGWKYVEFLRQTGMDAMNYSLPGPITRRGLRGYNYEQIQHVALCLTNIPPKTSVTCYISPVKMLKEYASAIVNPGFIVNGQKITFPVTLRMNDYLEFWGSGKARVFDPNGHTISEVTPTGNVPIVRPGSNEIKFSSDAGAGARVYSRVTIIAKGEPLRE